MSYTRLDGSEDEVYHPQRYPINASNTESILAHVDSNLTESGRRRRRHITHMTDGEYERCESDAGPQSHHCGENLDWCQDGVSKCAKQSSGSHFTFHSVGIGLLIGILLCFTNTYFGLQTGWVSMMSLQASLLGFAIFKPLTKRANMPFGPIENVLLQTTAVAVATMPLAGGFVGIIPALGMLTTEDNPAGPIHLTFGQLIMWGLGIAFFGVFFAIPLRYQTIIKEQLRFPSGTATAQMISLLHKREDPLVHARHLDDMDKEDGINTSALDQPYIVSSAVMTEGDDDEEVDIELESHAHSEDVVAHSSLSDENEWHSKMRALVWSFSISGIYTLAAHLIPVLGAIPLADWLTGFRIPFSEWNWYLTPSLSYAGQGIIMGMSTTVSMLMGSIVGWGILGPIAKVWGWAPGPVNDAKTGARGWIIWISLAIMIAESIVSLSVVTIEEIVKRWQASHGTSGWEASVLETQRARTRHHLLNNDDETPKGWLVPSWVTYSGLAVSSLLCVFTCSVLFDMSWHIGILSVAIACLLSILAVRALGETDLNPVSGIGKVSQVVFAGVAPGNIVVNLIAGGVAEAGAQQAGDMMQDLKTGHLLHASPRAQFYGQLIGSAVSVPVAAFAYATFSAAYQIPGPEFQAPTALVWLEMSRLVNGQPLPVNSGPFILLSALLFALLPILRIALPNARFHRYMPSGIAFAMGIYTTPNYVLPRVLGALGAHLYSRYSQLHGTRTKESLAVLIIVVASGFVLGEGTFSLVNLVLKVNGIGPIACVGCIPGLCSGC